MFLKQIAITALILSATVALAEDQFARLDIDKDGAVSKEEAAAMPGLLEVWEQLDVDADGKLNAEEFALFKPEEGDVEKSMEMKDKLSGTK